MVNLEIFTLILLFIGLCLVGITFLFIRKNQQSPELNFDELIFDKYNDELNDTAIAIYDELNTKYQEILVVYELIDKKIQELHSKELKTNKFEASTKFESKNKNYTTIKMQTVNNSINAKSIKKLNNISNDNVAIKVLNSELALEPTISSQSSNKQEEVRLLLKKGFSVEKIAKDLGIGIGEVKFIVELLKVKNE